MSDQQIKPATTTSDKPISDAPSSGGFSKSRNGILFGMGAAVAVTVPPSINSIADPTIRSLVALLAIVVVFGLGYLMLPSPAKRKG